MSKAVSVNTSSSNVGFGGTGVLIGLGLAVVGGVYMAGPSILNISTVTVCMAGLIVGIVLWLLLTDVNKLSGLIADNQLVALVLACVVGLDVLLHGGLVFKYPSMAIA